MDLAILTDSWVTKSVSAIASCKEEGVVSVAEKAAICFVKDDERTKGRKRRRCFSWLTSMIASMPHNGNIGPERKVV